MEPEIGGSLDEESSDESKVPKDEIPEYVTSEESKDEENNSLESSEEIFYDRREYLRLEEEYFKRWPKESSSSCKEELEEADREQT